MTKRDEILDLIFEFALGMIRYCDLLEEKRENSIARQFPNSCTSIGAYIRESQNAENTADFIH
ncbi:MAG: four helix bundle protein [Bacteroidales bacterium]|nr:four helix bundle protein [Bacteroidales bacterium]MCF8390273.1 four helix bundle protein [Bacteroidales bacterium]